MDNRSHGSWLEQVGKPSQAGISLSDQQIVDLKMQATRLRDQAELMRVQMASEKDRIRRINQLRDLESVGDQLRPIERALRDRGYGLPAQPAAQPSSAA